MRRGTSRPDPAVDRLGAVPREGGSPLFFSVGLAFPSLLVSLLERALDTVRALDLPLGAIPVLLAILLFATLFLRSAHRHVERATTLDPLQPFREVELTAEQARATISRPVSETGSVHIWRKDRISTVAEPYVPKTPSLVPPPPTPFVRNLLAAFSLLVIATMVYRHPFFYVYDLVVHWIGTAVFWPRPYVTSLATLTPTQVIPDYIFLVYIAFLLAYILAAGVLTSERFDRARVRRAIGIVATYAFAAILADVLFFTVGEPFSHSAVLLARGFLGGIFVAALVLSTVRLPESVLVRPILPPEPGVVFLFFLSLAVSAVLGLGILYLVFRFVGLGHGILPIGILLLLPIIALTIWALIGRAVYAALLAQRPPPPLSVYHPPVTVIIPAYNEAEGIAETIRSVDVAAARYPGFTEILVGNDGSTDPTLATAIREMLNLRHATGAVVDLPHGGKASVLNALLRIARGTILVRIDADTRISSALGFAKVVPHFADEDIGGVQGLLLPLQNEGWTRRLRFMEIAWNHLFLRRATMGFRATQVIDGAFSAFRRSDLLRAGGWVEWNGEDTEITIRLQRQGFRMRFEPGAAAFEDVPPDFARLERQRLRWNRGGIFARYRHLYSSFAEAWALGGLAMLYWLALFIRSGLRSGLYLYVVLAVLFVPTIVHLAIILLLLLVPRAIILSFYFVKYRRTRAIGWILAYPIFSVIKQHFAVKAWGTMFPGDSEEYA